MHSRRYEERARLQDHRYEIGPDNYTEPNRNVSEHSPRSRRSFSPHRVEGSRQGRDFRSPIGRRDSGWQLSVGRACRVRSRSRSKSPPFAHAHNRPQYDGGASPRNLPLTSEPLRRYEFSECMDRSACLTTDSKLQYGNGKSRLNRDDRVLDLVSSRYRMSSQKSVVLDDVASRRMNMLPQDGPTTKYFEGGINFSSADPNMGRFRDHKDQHTEPLLLDKLSAITSYRKEENPTFHPEDGSYSTLLPSHSKEFVGSSQFMDYATKSSVVSKVNFTGSPQDGISLPRDEYRRSSGKLTEDLAFSERDQRNKFYSGTDPENEFRRSSGKLIEDLAFREPDRRNKFDTGMDPEAEYKGLAYYQRDTFSPSRAKYQGHAYDRRITRENDEYAYSSDELYRTMALREQIDNNNDDLLKQSAISPLANHIDNYYCSRRNVNNTSSWDDPSLQRPTVADHTGGGRLSTRAQPSKEYLDFENHNFDYRRMSRVQENLIGFQRDYEISYMRVDNRGRDRDSVSHREIMNSSEFLADMDQHRLALEMRAEESSYGTSSWVPKKEKYNMNEDMNVLDSSLSSKWNYFNKTQDILDRGDEWIDQDARDLLLSDHVGKTNDLDRRLEREFDRADHHRLFASENWLSSHDTREHDQEHYSKRFKPGGRRFKGHSKTGSPSRCKPYHHNKRHDFHKADYVWIRDRDDNQVDKRRADTEESEEWVSSQKSFLPEDSENFKQLVGKFFLYFSKKLNDNPGVQKRYKEQGRAGSLFCIACGRSLSKEFKDTQSLAQHAFMSNKPWLRAQHLGLHKAICVLMGWRSLVLPDVTAFIPEDISSTEALAQEEDLIIWPPVVIIHNSSVSDNDLERQKASNIEAVENFLRGQHLSNAKMNIRPGKAADHSIMVVKFLGTFSGLKDAENLHKYFSENKHGRADFGKYASGKGKSTPGGGGGMVVGKKKVEELLLYGYMGIAKDLDKVDSDTKKKCLIKSKKEIHDFADGPVKT